MSNKNNSPKENLKSGLNSFGTSDSFNLSDKIVNATQFMGRADVHRAVPIQDVKEFIRLLKGNINVANDESYKEWLNRVIDKLTGKDLI